MRGDRGPVRAIRGPIILITVGVLFALQSFNIYTFGQTWPVLLIVIGLLHLCGRSTRYVSPSDPGGSQAVPPPPNYNWPPPPGASRGTPYSQSPYAQPGEGSAPPRNNPPAGSNPGGSV